MAIVSFKIRNTDNLTTEQVRGQPMSYRLCGYNPVYLGTASYADENYIYGEAIFDNVDNDMVICFDSPSIDSEEKSIFTIEVDGE